jgi:hypothetical protein
MTIITTTNKSLRKEWIAEKKLYKVKGSLLVYEPQKEVAKKIIYEFSSNDLVTLCAPPQWGKTGVSLFVSYMMTSKGGIDPNNVFFITAMSDRSWLLQTKGRVLPMWRKNVYHRNTLHYFEDRIDRLKREKKDRNILIIIDECHLANKRDFTIGKIFDSIDIKNPDTLKEKNIKILQISATPSNTLIDAEDWPNHAKVCPKFNNNYVSFQTFLDEDRLRDPHNLMTEEGSGNYFSEVCADTPKYHFIRSVSAGPTGRATYSLTRTSLQKQCSKYNAELIELNMTKTQGQIKKIFRDLDKQPEKHTFILIKNMLGASKTISDKFIGSVHESLPREKDNSSEIQGLPGRMCGWTKRRGISGPRIYCKTEIVENYLKLYDSGFDFHIEDLLWKDSRLKVNGDGKIKSTESYISIKEKEEEQHRDYHTLTNERTSV